MATFEALYTDGTRLILEADSMKVADGLVVFEQQLGGAKSTICVLGGDDLVACFDSQVTITWQEPEEEDEEE